MTSSNRVWDRLSEGVTSSNENTGWKNTDRPQPEARLQLGRTGAGSTLSSRLQGVNRHTNEGFGE